MVGTGIGKSRSVTYGLWRLMTREVPPVVVFEARRGQKVFIFTWQNNQWVVRSIDINDWKPASCKYLQKRNFSSMHLLRFAQVQFCPLRPSRHAVRTGSITRTLSKMVALTKQRFKVEAWSEESEAEVQAAHPYIDGAPELSEMLTRFEQVGGNLRVLLSNDADYDKYIVQQRDAQTFEVLRVIYGDLDTQGEKMVTRLFTYLSKDGTSCSVGFASTGAMEMVLNAHYDDLMKIVSNPNNPERRFLLEQCVGAIFATSLLTENLLTATPRKLHTRGSIQGVSHCLVAATGM